MLRLQRVMFLYVSYNTHLPRIFFTFKSVYLMCPIEFSDIFISFLFLIAISQFFFCLSFNYIDKNRISQISFRLVVFRHQYRSCSSLQSQLLIIYTISFTTECRYTEIFKNPFKLIYKTNNNQLLPFENQKSKKFWR